MGKTGGAVKKFFLLSAAAEYELSVCVLLTELYDNVVC